MTVSKNIIDGVEIITVENDHLRFSIAPDIGGKITSVYNKLLSKEFLWNNKGLDLKVNAPGSEFDPNFWGAIDELIPNDAPETIDSIAYPDHGELWTTPLQFEKQEERISVHGTLKLSGLYYQKTLYPDPNFPVIYMVYKIRNDTKERRHFLWKLHAALAINAGDQLITTAAKARVVDPAYSRFTDTREFNWPVIEKTDASIVPANNKTVDFFYLYDVEKAEMQLLNPQNGHLFSYSYDNKIFPYQWYFASFGGFLDHYTAVLEPCTTMPMSVNEAKDKGQCTVLEPGQELNTMVRLYAGEKKSYIP